MIETITYSSILTELNDESYEVNFYKGDLEDGFYDEQNQKIFINIASCEQQFEYHTSLLDKYCD